MSDPSGFVTNPPSTIVKVVNTARDDMNGQLGIAVAFQESNGRYLVHKVSTQQTIALKPENLIKASTVESFKGQFLQMKNDPRVQQQLREYYERAKRATHPVKPEYAAAGLALLWIVVVYMVGFTKTLMVTSVLLLVGVLVAPDVTDGASFKTIVQNLPRRSRQAMEETVPFLKGRLSDKVAAGIVVFMVVMAVQSLFVHSATRKPTAAGATPSSPEQPFVNNEQVQALQQQYYKLGFDDAKNSLDFGASLLVQQQEQQDAPPRPRGLGLDDAASGGGYPDFDYEAAAAQAPPTRTKSFGIGSAMSIFYLARTGYELGKDHAGGGGFSVERMMANARTLEPWKLGMIGFSMYNLVRAFI